MNFLFIGWMQEGKSDKVWGVIALEGDKWNGKCVTFWGRRGKKLSTLASRNDYELEKVVTSKRRKGYDKVNQNKLDEVYPEFKDDLEKTAMWAILTS